jgi:hypothetical protein
LARKWKDISEIGEEVHYLPRAAYGLGFQVNFLQTFSAVPSSLGSCQEKAKRQQVPETNGT